MNADPTRRSATSSLSSVSGRVQSRVSASAAASASASAAADADASRKGRDRIEIGAFDPTKLRSNSVIVINGPRNSGKSVLFEYLFMFLAPKYANVLAMTPTRDSAEMFERHIPYTNVYDEYDAEALKNAYDVQRTLCSELKSRLIRSGIATPENVLDVPEDIRRSFLVVFDDMMADHAQVSRDKTINDIVVNGRHEWTGFINMQQYIKLLAPKIRNNMDYLFLMQDPSPSSVETLYEQFFGKGMFSNYATFAKVYNEATSNYNCLVIDMKLRTNDPRKRLFSIKASVDIPRYLSCSAGIWNLALRFARSGKEEEEKRLKQVSMYSSVIKDALRGKRKQTGAPAATVVETDASAGASAGQRKKPRKDSEDITVVVQTASLAPPKEADESAAPAAVPAPAAPAAEDDALSIASMHSEMKRKQMQSMIDRAVKRRRM